jgi:hypothetical protein
MVCTDEPNQRQILPHPYPTLRWNIFILYNLWSEILPIQYKCFSQTVKMCCFFEISWQYFTKFRLLRGTKFREIWNKIFGNPITLLLYDVNSLRLVTFWVLLIPNIHLRCIGHNFNFISHWFESLFDNDKFETLAIISKWVYTVLHYSNRK